jgi:hypothetical protein
MEHPNPEVQAALVRLSDALCEWERNTGRQSVLILREEGGVVYRAQSGKPVDSPFLSDADMLATVKAESL